jgi:uncharacterized membrane protein
MSGEMRTLAEGVTRRRSTATAYSRTLAVVLIPFLAIAVVLLYLLPGETDTLFAWTIEPPLTAMLLASAYIGGIWFFAAGARRSGWSTISRGMPAVLLFASLLLLATLLHLDRFHAGHISFIAWIGLYLTTPFLVVAAMLLHRRSGDASRAVSEYAIPLSVRVVLACLGLGSLIAGASLFVGIDAVVSAWPWALTPLTAQVTGAVLTLPGAVNLALLLDGRWSAFRTIFQAQIVSLVAIVGALVVRHDDIHRPGPGIVFSVGIALSLAAYLAFYAYCEHRRGTAGEAND